MDLDHQQVGTTDPGNHKVPISDALIWMVAAGVGMGISRVITVRTAATVWEVATGRGAAHLSQPAPSASSIAGVSM